ncbi:MAG TPA: TetR/AcrR family transcriptional regulator [Methanolinea sp.]|nr:MAG: DNA-binding transcriptional repressor AcrR [Methanoregulaceae archaeon PtaU1.Bin066]HNQ30106.1 TetR/AcrR family transcriptional regulator [Methanolinea sp.]
MARLFPEYREEVQKKIIATAHTLFHEKGYSNTKMSEIAAALGVTKPTLYHYFDTKEKLFIAVAEHERKMLQEFIIESFTDRDFVAGATAFFDTIMEGFLKNIGPESVAIITRDDHLRQIILDDREKFIDVIAGFLAERKATGEIREDADVRILACTFNALFQGLLIYAMQGMRTDDLRLVWNSAVKGLTQKGS